MFSESETKLPDPFKPFHKDFFHDQKAFSLFLFTHAASCAFW